MEPFKNLISEDVVHQLATHLHQQMPKLDKAAFTASILPALEDLELKQRVQLISEKMLEVLPKPVRRRNKILLAMLHPNASPDGAADDTHQGISGWGIWPLTDVIGQSGLADFDHSMETLRQMTMRWTSEFDVRPFIHADPERALATLQLWAQDSNEHVRRLASEGSRPRLPWGMRLNALIENPELTLPILAALKDDPSEYVRRSVSNHLNDISKDHPDLVASIAEQWIQNATKERQKLIRHACRTLIKQGHKQALAVFGVMPPKIHEPRISITTKSVSLGESLQFEVTLTSDSNKPQKLLLDYIVHHQKANGTLSPKVFKWTQLTLNPGENAQLQRQHAIRPITTRKYYAGEHALSIRINGEDFGYKAFELTVS